MATPKNLPKGLIISSEAQYLLHTMNQKFEELKVLIRQEAPIPARDYYTATEVCKKLSISRSKFEQMKRDGVFNTVKPSGTGKVLVPAEELSKLFPNTFNAQ
ncbi:MerR family transcriptional regulator [Siphonobacter curvatus]|uniref:Uncharacterized protein n=1 Tax=Siphonobacter curvatus TaxID=2094562 RepID=A0A2S7INZ9_9BACT|nr:hypothetical protein [Siphonobacter curvatus]PQA59425.1 hypothetical protein C5O19_07170 [Siphonobacter curvatus]